MRVLGAAARAALVRLADCGGRVEGTGAWPEICEISGVRCPDSLVGRWVAEVRVDRPDGGMDLAYVLLPRGRAVVDAERLRRIHTAGEAGSDG